MEDKHRNTDMKPLACHHHHHHSMNLVTHSSSHIVRIVTKKLYDGLLM